MLALLGATLTGSFVSYYDKVGLNTGMNRTKFLFLKSVGLLPFVPFLFLFFPFELHFSWLFFLLLVGIVAVNITATIGFVGVARKNSPHESMMYSTLSIPLVYFIDTLIGTLQFEWITFFYLSLIIVGVFLLTNFNLKAISFKFSLLLGLISSAAKGYLLFFFLKSTSTPVYLLLVYSLTSIILLLFFKTKITSVTKQDAKWAITTQFAGTLGLTLNTILLTQSVSFYMLRMPLILVGLTLTSFFVKNQKLAKAPSVKNVFAVLLCIVGIVLFNFTKF